MRIGITALLLVLVLPAFADDAVQIGTPRQTPQAARSHPFPLDAKVSLRMKRVSLPEYLGEVGRQAGLHFNLVPGLEHCAVSAFLKRRTAREALRLALEVRGVSYEQLGRSETYTVMPRGTSICPTPPPVSRPFGSCKAGSGKRISLECTSAMLSEYADKIYEQADGNFFFPNGAEFESLSANLQGATLKDAVGELKKHESIVVSDVSGVYVVALKQR